MDKFDTLAIVTEQAEAKYGPLAGCSVFILEGLKSVIEAVEKMDGLKMNSAQILCVIDMMIEGLRTGRVLDESDLGKIWNAHDL